MRLDDASPQILIEGRWRWSRIRSFSDSLTPEAIPGCFVSPAACHLDNAMDNTFCFALLYDPKRDGVPTAERLEVRKSASHRMAIEQPLAKRHCAEAPDLALSASEWEAP